MKIKKFTTRNLFLCLFAILYLSVAAVSTFHAFHFFGLANNQVMAAMLAGTFEIGQAAVLFSLLTDSSNRKKYMPWVLMCILTLVQVLGNVFSSYKYLITNSVENLRYFKEPIFIWTDLPDDQTTVIITYIVGAILPICALLLTSMITNYLTDNEEEQKSLSLGIDKEIEKGPQNQQIILNDKEDFDEVYNNEDISSDDTDKVNIDNNNTEELKESSNKLLTESSEDEEIEDEEIENIEKEPDDVKNNEDNGFGDNKVNVDKKENNSHFINLN